MEYQKTRLTASIVVNSIITVHYFEYASSYFFPGESHDFWELLYVDKGEVLVTAGMDTIELKTGEMVFHQPMEFHNVRANGVVAPNLVVVSFDCHSKAMRFFHKKILQISEQQHSCLAKIVETAYQIFDSPLNDPALKCLVKKPAKEIPFGSEQILKASLELMLVDMIQNAQPLPQRVTATAFYRQSDLDLFSRTISLFEENLHEQLSIDDVCSALLVSRSRLQKLFHEKTGRGVMDNFTRMKIEHAKRQIREGRLNFTEIAESLGYSSLFYFSRQFKKTTGMTPTEYSLSIQSKAYAPLQGY